MKCTNVCIEKRNEQFLFFFFSNQPNRKRNKTKNCEEKGQKFQKKETNKTNNHIDGNEFDARVLFT